MFDIQTFIKLGVCRDVNQLIENGPGDIELNLGAGKKLLPGTVPLDLPAWDANKGVPYIDSIVSGIWMIHMLEHVEKPIELLKECQRVLAPGGFINIVVPYYSSNLNAQELDHKHSFSEETFPALLRQKEFYSKNLEGFEWNMDINFNLIIGVHERNMCLYVQLVKK